MPTFTLIIADEPFDAQDPGAAPFVESVAHGAGGGVSTPATEAFRRCLDAIAGQPVNIPAPGDSGVAVETDKDANCCLRDALDSTADALEDGVELLDQIVAGQHRGEFVLESDEAPDRLRAAALEAAADLRQALKVFLEVADWPEPGEDDA